MVRKIIELEAGTIRPVSRGLWVAAAEKLQEAEGGIEIMEARTDRIQFEAGWTRFVDSLEEFWTRFYDEGKATFSAFQPWAGTIDAKRKSDPLLQYLYQARHQSQHGRIAMQWSAPALKIAPNFNGHLRSLKVFPDGTYEMDSAPLHPSFPEATIKHSPGDPILPTIENKKFCQTFAPPEEFDGAKLINTSPCAVSRIGLEFYESVLEQAFLKFSA